MEKSKFYKNPYFGCHEFDSPDVVGSGERINPVFLAELTKARLHSETSYVITSGIRTVEHNKSVGGVEDSDHVTGEGADISAVLPWKRHAVLKGLFASNIKTIIIYKTHIHVSLDAHKTHATISVKY